MLLLGYFVLLAVGLNCNAAPVPCGPPPRDSEFELQGTLQESYPPGTTLTFNCRPGYSRQGSIKKVCADGNWASIAQGVCKRKSCGHPGDIEFGTFDLKEGDGFVFGAVVEYSCDEGYQMVSKQRTRECTATGWSHYPPHCEVRKCPPVEAAAGVKVITTSYDDEEFSVGQVVKFQCQDPKLKLDGLSEIFCTSEGTWSADPPQCTTITCKEPTITNGRVENPRAIYNEGEKLPFKCNKKYKPYRSEDVICKANGWSPEPLCEDISCYPDYVANGKVEKTKEIYKEGDTIVLNCNYGYQIEFSPDEPRKCTANGWFPPLKCISQTCIRPEIADGQLYYNYYFPKELGTYIDYRCSDGFRTQNKRYYGRSYCTENGWNPKPKCTKTCSSYNAQVENGYLQNSDDYYLVGEKVQFSCRQSYLTKDKQNNGERECLPNGKFTEDQCSKFCDVTQLPVGNYAPDKKIFVVGETLLFECNNGFVIASGKTTTNIQCLQTGWSPFPRCIEYKCVVEGTNLISQRRDYKIGEVAQISCPPDYTLKGSELIQCYNNGWGPELPKCEQEIKCTLPRFKESNLVKNPNKLNFKVNEEVSLSCHKNLFLNGANLIRCTSDGWVPTLPVCQKDIPKPHEDDEQPEKVCTIPNINLIRSPHYPSYVVGKEVQFSCQDNFQRIGQRTSICTQDGWKPDLPTCQARNPEPTQASTESATQEENEGKGPQLRKRINESFITPENPEPTQPSTESARQEKRQKCPPAHSPINAEIKNPKAEYYSGDTVEIECSPKYILNGDRIILCKDGKWQSSPQCIPLQKCPKPPIIKDGEITEETRKSEYFTDDIVKYSCNPGFHITGSDESRCTERTWLAAPQCTEDPCSPPPSVTNANVVNKKKLYKHGEYAEYVCVNNYKIAEEKPATCLEGKWWHVPTCVYISCSPPPEIENGVLTGKKKNQYASGEKVRYGCNNGYAFEKKTNEKSEAICEETQWKSIPVCRKIGERCGPAPVVQYGDYLGPKQNNYTSGYIMQYKCPKFYKTEGETLVRCENGVWGDPPVCLEPCTANANAKDMKENNIEFKWGNFNINYTQEIEEWNKRQ